MHSTHIFSVACGVGRMTEGRFLRPPTAVV